MLNSSSSSSSSSTFCSSSSKISFLTLSSSSSSPSSSSFFFRQFEMFFLRHVFFFFFLVFLFSFFFPTSPKPQNVQTKNFLAFFNNNTRTLFVNAALFQHILSHQKLHTPRARAQAGPTHPPPNHPRGET